MSDDRQEPPAGNDDATRPLPSERDGDADATRAMRSGGPAEDDATRAMGRSEHADATRAMPAAGGPAGREPADATRPLPQGDQDATARRRAPDATARQEPVAAAPAWSGRAGVPPPRPVGYPEPATEWYAEEQGGRRWWMPILLGILALVLIALIGLGVWLALRAAERNSGPATVPSVVPSTAPETSAAPTTTAPSTSPPTTPPTSAPARVPVPPLVGLPEDAARAVLDRLNVDYRVVRRTSDRPAGTVIETDPAAGELISDGDQLTVVVAKAEAPTTASATPTPGPTATVTP
ncbi:PASTA domain-containing protein [Micromonospora sp. DR5-3]|uniref:PASTA domain-containing protein n=1 Tax=unclassified Micromonospora TaxID=2617518 RepID=UPI0011DA71D3|nr:MULTISPECIES: PASTA domain-containing protein [unclassified Micromonospora]MCW3813775.1 PASTA domain-containing protein [Micromonospora sp. DR5-3]TYC25542.1 PASTA domain-containing protein [Micromonospora sp. MP36]